MKKVRDIEDIEQRARSIYGNSSDTSFVRGQYCRGARDQEKIMKSSIIEKAIMWVKFYNENGGCNFDHWESSLKKIIDC